MNISTQEESFTGRDLNFLFIRYSNALTGDNHFSLSNVASVNTYQ